MPIHPFFNIIQQHHLPIQLTSNLHAEFALPSDTRAEGVELVVLLADDAAVVGVDLLVVEAGLVGCGIRVGVVAVREEGCAVWVIGRVGAGGRRVVAEADGFVVGGSGALLCGVEVWGERGVVGGARCGGGRGG